MEWRPMEERTEHGQVPLAVPYLHKIIYSARTWREITPWLRQARVLAPTFNDWYLLLKIDFRTLGH